MFFFQNVLFSKTSKVFSESFPVISVVQITDVILALPLLFHCSLSARGCPGYPPRQSVTADNDSMVPTSSHDTFTV